MRKTLQEVAGYLKTIVVPEPQEAYTIDPVFESIAPPEHIKAGVLAFRAFLCELYDTLAAKGDAYDVYKKVAHEYEDRIGLSGYYPHLHNVKTALMRIGYHGVLAEDAKTLLCDRKIWNEKLSIVKNMECLRFLKDCGIGIDGLDFNAKKLNPSDVETIIISYPGNPAMLTGLKVMAVAEADHGTLTNQDVFMRCDYRALAMKEPDVFVILKDAIRPLSRDMQDFALHLHRHYLDQGLQCAVETKGFYHYIKYTFKRKVVWGLNASLSNGIHINVKAQNMHRYADTVEALPPVMQEVIAKGYGCGRKREGIGHCDGGCRGMILPLDDSDISKDIETWLDKEVACLQSK